MAVSQAAPITWTNTGTTLVDESNVSLSGIFVHAGNWGGAARTVTIGSESMFFADIGVQNVTGTNPVPGTANVAVTGNGEGQDVNLFIPPGTINEDLHYVMDGGGWDGANPKRLVLNNLTAGATYQVQIFVSDDRACCSGRTQKWSDNVTNGAGSETANLAVGTSPFVIGTFVADGNTQLVYLHGTTAVTPVPTIINGYILREIPGPDSDTDGLPDYWEALYTTPSSTTALFPTGNPDADGLDNATEYLKRTNPLVADTDTDGLSDGEEVNTIHSSPILIDTDGDGLSDFVEAGPGGYGSSPLLVDSDNDGFVDKVEFDAVPPTNPNVASSNPAGVVPQKRGFNNLIGGDVTDPTNDGVSITAAGTNFDWAQIVASVNGTFLGEGAYNLFDNLVGVASSKWYIANISTVTPPSLATRYAPLTALTGVTLTSGNDAPERDPVVWEIQGSNNGTTWTTLFRWNYGSPWAPSERNHTYSITFPQKTYPYPWYRFQVFSVASGIATGAFQLDELELIGEQTDADNDGDGIPKLVEDYYTFLDDSNFADGDADEDGDGLSNALEWSSVPRTSMILADTDGDGLNDGQEADLETNPTLADTDADGLNDFREAGAGGTGTNPLVADTDGDGFNDGEEVNSTPPTDPLSATSAPFKVTRLGTGTAALLGGDLTDPENDINDNLTTAGNTGSGFNWVSIATNSTKNYFNGTSQTAGTNEGIRNIFDNKVGGGEAKWCCEIAPKFVTVEFATPVSLTHFTLASADDSLDRSPSEWVMAGSNDGTTFTTIVADTSPGTHFFTEVNQVVRFDLAGPSPAYKFIRFSIVDTPAVLNPSTNAIQMSEMELFTTPVIDLKVVSSGFDAAGDFKLTVTGLKTNLSYQLYRSTSLLPGAWTAVGTPLTPPTTTEIFTDEDPPAGKSFYRIKDLPPP